MKFVIQRVSKASVSVAKKIVGEIQNGFLVFVGVCDTDTYEIADKMVSKLLNLRIFSDENGKTNLDLKKVNGGLLIISQFTLYADCRKGNRPSFTKAGNPDYANEMYEYILKKCSDEIPHVAHGTFGEHMEVSLINDGPFTVILDSDEICK
ncbi:D-aminoacyl-tRNA deacylase [Parablautia intestinalis]|uniref:D-aminoacyl-tRNA deacylase n=1 Tax=Parablautia intestinalis TaxID=2320100 RepID=UPI00259D1C47|nr:D-aminoacyl-tRNA deacylase [Parablautia intestinalis]